MVFFLKNLCVSELAVEDVHLEKPQVHMTRTYDDLSGTQSLFPLNVDFRTLVVTGGRIVNQNHVLCDNLFTVPTDEGLRYTLDLCVTGQACQAMGCMHRGKLCGRVNGTVTGSSVVAFALHMDGEFLLHNHSAAQVFSEGVLKGNMQGNHIVLSLDAVLNNKIHLTVKTDITFGSLNPMTVNFYGHLDRASAAEALGLWPSFFESKVRSWVSKNIKAGEVKNFEVQGQTTWATKSAHLSTSFQGTAELMDVDLLYHDQLPGVHKAKGSAIFTHNSLAVHVHSGCTGNLKVNKGTVRIGNKKLDISLNISGPVREALTLIHLPPLYCLQDIPLKPEQTSGMVMTDFALSFPLKTGLSLKDIQVRAQATVQKATIERLLLKQRLTQVQMQLFVDNHTFSLEGHGKMVVPCHFYAKQELGQQPHLQFVFKSIENKVFEKMGLLPCSMGQMRGQLALDVECQKQKQPISVVFSAIEGKMTLPLFAHLQPIAAMPLIITVTGFLNAGSASQWSATIAQNKKTYGTFEGTNRWGSLHAFSATIETKNQGSLRCKGYKGTQWQWIVEGEKINLLDFQGKMNVLHEDVEVACQMTLKNVFYKDHVLFPHLMGTLRMERGRWSFSRLLGRRVGSETMLEKPRILLIVAFILNQESLNPTGEITNDDNEQAQR